MDLTRGQWSLSGGCSGRRSRRRLTHSRLQNQRLTPVARPRRSCRQTRSHSRDKATGGTGEKRKRHPGASAFVVSSRLAVLPPGRPAPAKGNRRWARTKRTIPLRPPTESTPEGHVCLHLFERGYLAARMGVGRIACTGASQPNKHKAIDQASSRKWSRAPRGGHAALANQRRAWAHVVAVAGPLRVHGRISWAVRTEWANGLIACLVC